MTLNYAVICLYLSYTETVRSCSNKGCLCGEREEFTTCKTASVKSTTRLFDNDCFLYRKIKSECTLQQDLDTIQKWESHYLMWFNPDKWEVLQITTRRTPLQFKYTIHGQVLNNFNSAKNLGLNIHKTFRWDNEMTKLTNSNQSH
jgi:hypothetical protein